MVSLIDVSLRKLQGLSVPKSFKHVNDSGITHPIQKNTLKYIPSMYVNFVSNI